MSDFNVDDFLRSVLRPPTATPKRTSEAFKQRLNATLKERLPGYAKPRSSALFVYRGGLDLSLIARGMAVASEREAVVVQLESDDLQRGEANLLLEPLTSGKLLLLIHHGSSTMAANLADYWPRFCAAPDHYLAAVGGGLTLGGHLRCDAPGSVIVVQTASMDRARSSLDEWPLVERDAAELALLAGGFPGPVVRIGVPPGSFEAFESHEAAYRAYRQLVEALGAAGHARSTAEGLLRPVLNGVDPRTLLPDFRYHGVDLSLYDELLPRLVVLAEHCATLSGGSHRSDPLPDVYAAALVVCRSWEAAEDGSIFYRGQRNAEWPVVPAFFRPNRDGSPPDLEARQQRLRRLVDLMRSAFPAMDEPQYLAACQHVSSEARTPTWLVDVTWHPLVALYFASSGGVAGDVGVIDRIIKVEWQHYVAARDDVPGGLIAADMPAIERIRRQRGLFLNAPRADLYQGYSPYRIWFHQQPGVTFTDTLADAPIATEWLLPDEPRLDRLIEALDHPAPPENAASRVARPADPRIRLTAAEIMRTVADRAEVRELNAYHRLVLEVVCDLYAHPEEWVVADDEAKHSLHRLGEVIALLAGYQRDGRRCDVQSALQFSEARVTTEEFTSLVTLGRRRWMERHRVPPAAVVEEVGEMLAVVSALAPTAFAVVLPGPPDHVTEVMRALGGDGRWRTADLRGASPAEVGRLAEGLVSGGAVLVAAAPTLEPPLLRVLTKAVIDRRPAVWAGARELPIAADAVLGFVIAPGNMNFGETEAAHVIPYTCHVDQFDPARTPRHQGFSAQS